MKKYFYMMIGLPGSGKSTWVKENIFDTRVKIFSTDNLIEEAAKRAGLTYNEVFEDNIEEATKTFFSGIRDAVAKGEDILVDRTNLTRKSRKKILDMIPDDYTKVAVLVKCDNLFLHEHRLMNRPGKNIPSNVIDNMRRTFEEPSIKEDFSSITLVNSAQHLEEV